MSDDKSYRQNARDPLAEIEALKKRVEALEKQPETIKVLRDPWRWKVWHVLATFFVCLVLWSVGTCVLVRLRTYPVPFTRCAPCG